MSEPFLVWSSNLKPEQAEALIAWGKAIRQAERERIIKLIEAEMQGRDSWLDVIELIEGQNA